MRSTTRRALGGETLTYFTVARASIDLLPERGAALGPGVRTKRPCGGELPELVPDHRLGDVDRDMLATVVDGDRVSDHLRNDRRSAGPGLDHALVPATVHLRHLDHQVVVH